MFNKDVLKGIFLAKAKGHIGITRNKDILIGYRVKLTINVRGKEKFLEAIKRTLLQYGIESKIKLKQSASRPTPILIISGAKNLALVMHHGIWCSKLQQDAGNDTSFSRAVRIVAESRHLRLEGLEELFKIKELM